MKNVFEAYEEYIKPTEVKPVEVNEDVIEIFNEEEKTEPAAEVKNEPPKNEFKYPEIDYDKLAAAMLKAQGTNTDNGDGIKAE